MGKGSQQKNKKNQKGYESKEQRRARQEAQKEAQEACLKVLPTVGGIILFLLVAFALYVRSVPPKVVSKAPEQPPLKPEDLTKFDVLKDAATEEVPVGAKIDTLPEDSSMTEDDGETVEL
mmetsp:Transcript_22504/g.31386  ORF Transcript_22504/g.31386 Transcript_22504/m.31386 type:complete len:120 (+) Transcript_22504:115-474(+)